MVVTTTLWLACTSKSPKQDNPAAAEDAAAAKDAAPPRAAGEPAAVVPLDGGVPTEVVIRSEAADPAHARAVSGPRRPPVGFLELRPAVATPVIAHQAPDPSSPKIATLDNAGVHAGSRPCEWVAWWPADDKEGRARCGDVVELEEDREAIPVQETSEVDGERWVRVIARADGASGWIRTAAPYHAIEDVLTDRKRLTYLTGHWDRKLHARPGVRPSRLRSARPENVYEPLGHRWVGGVLWLHVKVVSSLCDEDEVRTRGSGWVRAWDGTGRLTAWLYSRGC